MLDMSVYSGALSKDAPSDPQDVWSLVTSLLDADFDAVCDSLQGRARAVLSWMQQNDSALPAADCLYLQHLVSAACAWWLS